MTIVTLRKPIEFAAYRCNGVLIQDAFIRRLKDHVDFKPIYPEFGIGFCVPANAPK